MIFPAQHMAALAAQGRYGDTELAHVTPAEKDLLQALGGAGTVNPNTGLREYYDVSEAFGSAGGGMAIGPSGGDPRGESTAGPGGNIGAPTSPGLAVDAPSSAPSTDLKGAVSGAGTLLGTLLSGGSSLINPVGGLISAITQNAPENIAPGVVAGKGVGALLNLTLGEGLGLPNQGLQDAGVGTLGGSDMGITQPDSSAIASSASTAAASAPAAAKSILPQSPIAGLDAQTYDYLRRMGIIA